MDSKGLAHARSLILLGYSVRALAQSACRAGWQPLGIDCFADRDLAACGPAIRITRYPVEFLRALSSAPQAPWVYTGSLENYPRLVDRLAALRPLWGNPGSVLRQVRRVAFLADAAQAAGLPFAEIRPSPPACPPPESAGWLVKPRRSGGGVGVRPWEGPLPPLPRGSYLQRYVAGEPAGAIFLFAEGRATLLGITRQLLGRDVGGPTPFHYAGSIGPLAPSADEQRGLARLADVLAQRAALVGLVNLDYVRQPRTLVPLEINPRYSASVEVLERACDVPLLPWHLAACGGPPAATQPAFLRPRRAAGKVIVYAPLPVTVEGLEAARRQARLADEGIALADVPAGPLAAAAQQPLCTLLAEGDDAAEVAQRLVRAAGRLTRCLRSSARWAGS
jgi:predicted ATP-grasp superfamily ATP-dependent carboligase